MGVTVRDVPERQRYEAHADGELAGFAEYETTNGTLVFTHTEVDDRFEGQGVGSTLARQALDAARHAGLSVVPRCPFIRSWIERHPEYLDLVTS